jgi:predicted nucleic-acid-binding Zn-ribbon protein
MMNVAPCPNCGSKNLFKSNAVSAGGGHAPNYLPGLGGFISAEKFHLVLCGNCGLTRFFARQEALRKVADAKKWQRI